MSNIEHLKKSFAFYLKNKEDLKKKYYGEYLVIKDSEILGHYKSEELAITETTKKGFKLGEFIVQIVLDNDGTQANFVSNVYV
jgi:hypothetical protein